MLKEVNHTHICLISKHTNVENVEDYSPIFLRNTTYKIIGKCLVERLKTYLPTLISKNQQLLLLGTESQITSFLLKRLLKGFNQKQSAHKLCVQMDISTTFDSLSRDFVFLMLKRMSFKEEFIGWIRACISTTSFATMVNGQLLQIFGSS